MQQKDPKNYSVIVIYSNGEASKQLSYHLLGVKGQATSSRQRYSAKYLLFMSYNSVEKKKV